MSWEMVLLGDVIETLKGYAFKSGHYVESGVPIVRASNFTMDSISNDDLKFYTEDEAIQFRKYELSTDDVLIQTVGSWESNPASVVGKVVRVPQLLDGALLNQNIVKVFPADKDQLDLQYLFYRLKCHDFKRHNIGNAVGAANQASITLDTIRAFAFLLPNIVEQRRIATILRGYDDLIENNQKQIKLLEEAAQRLYKEWFVDLRFPGHETTSITDGIPQGWEERNIDDVFSVQYGKMLPTSLLVPNGEYPVYGANGVIGYYTKANCFDYVTLITSRGNGSGDVLRTHHKASFVTNNSFVVLPKESYGHFELPFAYHLMKTLDFKSICTGSAQPQLTNKSISMLNVTVPTPAVVKAFCNIANPMFAKIELLYKQIQAAAEARDRLLPKLMNGEIEV
jgi:type I restriction enzyme S subunit